jgi:hypothetical protein
VSNLELAEFIADTCGKVLNYEMVRPRARHCQIVIHHHAQ